MLIPICVALLYASAATESQDSEAAEAGESVELLCQLLQDPDEQVRRQAIHDLRMMARRTDRIGGKRIEQGPEFDPKVEGLVPYLVAAANDEVEINRICALYALADTRDPLAVLELRNRLEDPSEKVRFHAACFLTEYQDASGLPEMRDALARLCTTDNKDDFDHYSQAEMLLASFERIVGKSFGEIPLNPLLCSDTREIPLIKERYDNLLETWAEWWAWEPKAQTN
jgi:HEAT repeat protein